MPDPAIGQREAIKNALDAAETAVAAVNNDAGADVVMTADERIADARAAIDAAADVPGPGKTHSPEMSMLSKAACALPRPLAQPQ